MPNVRLHTGQICFDSLAGHFIRNSDKVADKSETLNDRGSDLLQFCVCKNEQTWEHPHHNIQADTESVWGGIHLSNDENRAGCLFLVFTLMYILVGAFLIKGAKYSADSMQMINSVQEVWFTEHGND